MEVNRRPNAVIALEILLSGFPLQFKGENTKYYYQDGVFGIRGIKYSTNNKPLGGVLLPTDLSLPDFIKLCDEIPFEELYTQSCQMVLTLHNRKKRG